MRLLLILFLIGLTSAVPMAPIGRAAPNFSAGSDGPVAPNDTIVSPPQRPQRPSQMTQRMVPTAPAAPTARPGRTVPSSITDPLFRALYANATFVIDYVWMTDKKKEASSSGIKYDRMKFCGQKKEDPSLSGAQVTFGRRKRGDQDEYSHPVYRDVDGCYRIKDTSEDSSENFEFVLMSEDAKSPYEPMSRFAVGTIGEYREVKGLSYEDCLNPDSFFIVFDSHAKHLEEFGGTCSPLENGDVECHFLTSNKMVTIEHDEERIVFVCIREKPEYMKYCQELPESSKLWIFYNSTRILGIDVLRSHEKPVDVNLFKGDTPLEIVDWSWGGPGSVTTKEKFSPSDELYTFCGKNSEGRVTHRTTIQDISLIVQKFKMGSRTYLSFNFHPPKTPPKNGYYPIYTYASDYLTRLHCRGSVSCHGFLVQSEGGPEFDDFLYIHLPVGRVNVPIPK